MNNKSSQFEGASASEMLRCDSDRETQTQTQHEA